MSVRVECVADLGCRLGEGPVWDEREGRLWWVDIKAPAVHRYDPSSGRVDSWAAPEPVSALALREAGGLLLSLKSGFAFLDPDAGEVSHLLDPEPGLPGNRLNDGACDPRGRFWAGSMDDAEQQPTGHLYRLDPDLRLTRFDASFVVTNGPAFAPDGTILYFADSPQRTIWAYPYDPERGLPGPRRLFAQLGEADGHPDGMCVDAEGCLWSAHWDGGRLTRYTPDGSVERTVLLPVPRVTKPCFGGRGLDEIYVTSARIGLDAAGLARAPLSGGLFRITGLGVRGAPAPRFAG
jgi:sugar lactone lactonase YvrE